jgi:hypothetical protein
MLARILPSRKTATAVSSQEDSMASIVTELFCMRLQKCKQLLNLHLMAM